MSLYEPRWHEPDEMLIKKSGHGGSDYLTVRMFINCICENKQPEFPFDLHSSISMSSVAILAHRSMLEGGMPYDIPDFTKEEDRKKYETDSLSPFPNGNGVQNSIPCCSHPEHRPTEEQIRLYKQYFQISD